MPSIPPPEQLLERAHLSETLLMGPGPTNVLDSVRQTYDLPTVGYLNPEFTHVMDQCKAGIQYLLQTDNWLTFAVPGTGHAGMECAIMNLLESGETLLVVVAGTWGHRVCELGRRLWLKVETLEVPEGQAASCEEIITLIKDKRPRAVCICHGESSTGVLQRLEGVGRACHEVEALLIVDAVASAGGVELNTDDLEIDCVFTASQKVLNAPAGLAPITFSQRAYERMTKRVTPSPSFYHDALELGNYWGCFKERRHYHHTGMTLLVYALTAALAELAKTGLEGMIERHRENAAYLREALEQAGFTLYVQDKSIQLDTLTTVTVPEGLCAKVVTDRLLEEKIEIGIGMGPTLGKIWRIGTFGMNSDKAKIDRVVGALKRVVDQCTHVERSAECVQKCGSSCQQKCGSSMH